jgi:alkanesulfonate monooxygenase SsuD/methylene tetrahydromethanopterin reductase-like flavin-dependent oxidoreductase (luciferase family)
MRVGVQLPEVERVVRWPEIRTMAEAIEDLEFDSIWVGDHLLYEEDGVRTGPWEAWTQLAAIAATTRRVEIGPLVAALPFHEPAVLAKMVATVDEVSGGRLVVGVGAGWNEVEFRAFGLPFEHRVARFEEAFEILRRLLAGERFDFDGRFYRLEGAELLPPPARSGGPKFMVGSIGPRMLAATLPHVSAWNVWFDEFDNRPEGVERPMRALQRGCETVGRDPATIEKTIAVLVQLGPVATRRNSLQPISGSTADIAGVLERFAGAGIDGVQLVLDPITLESIERAAEAVAELRDRLSR